MGGGGMYISPASVLLPCGIDAACIPPDEALSVHYTPPPPIFQLSAMKTIYIPGFGGVVSVVEIDKSHLICKRLVLDVEFDKNIELERRRRDILQSELDVYSLLHGSPYVFPIVGRVERVRHFVVYDDPYVKDVPVTDRFLIPFAGTLSQWCLGFRTEWTMQEKECLALTLMDAMLDFEQRGVYTTDLKCSNILLTKGILKIIDLDLQTHTLGYSRWGVEGGNAVQALYNMSMAIKELFLSGTTYTIHREGAVPKPFVQLIEWCEEDPFGSVAEMMVKTADMLDPVRASVKNMSASTLAEARLSRCRSLAKTEDEWRFARTYDSELDEYFSWLPRYFEVPSLPLICA
ncbi:uncharacterized protein EV420DRAFT_1748096 [Desarmillaria tabescens]|uniref:Protein kinase domain-containing protein n=1 Tax=Armillaria tabescens TaxID=1929756 RepID=A0AA39KCU4_ARMTA|nr:uncharacterized protein EV420DRAFT_1748096 [Desarmillaria tabescens]KAK0458637.1 hypothetical protein EV420DRAFT_1748096 [Desarmillaria tabescens]